MSQLDVTPKAEDTLIAVAVEEPATQALEVIDEATADLVAELTEAVECGVAAEAAAAAAPMEAAQVEAVEAAPVEPRRSNSRRSTLALTGDKPPRKRVPYPTPEAAEAAKPRKAAPVEVVRGESLKDGLKRVRKGLWHTGVPSDQEHSTTLVAREVHDTMLEVQGGGVFIREYLPSDMLVPESGEILLTPTPQRQDVAEKCRKQKQQVAEFYGYVVMHRVGQRFQYRLMAVPEGMQQGRKPPLSTHVRRILLLGSREEIQTARAFQLYTRKVRNADGVSTLVFAFAVH